jgi:hypothetical protein
MQLKDFLNMVVDNFMAVTIDEYSTGEVKTLYTLNPREAFGACEVIPSDIQTKEIKYILPLYTSVSIVLKN